MSHFSCAAPFYVIKRATLYCTKEGCFIEQYTFTQLQHETELVQNIVLERQTITAETLQDVMAIGITFTRCHFIDCTFTQIDFTDAAFAHCDLSNCTFHDSLLYRTSFTNCKMVGTTFTNVTLTESNFVDSFMQRVAFEDNTFDYVHFQSCTLTESDWYVVNHRKLTFQQCELTDARFEQTSLSGLDLSTSHFLALHVAAQDAQNCIIHAEHAPIFLALYGIHIRTQS